MEEARKLKKKKNQLPSTLTSFKKNADGIIFEVLKNTMNSSKSHFVILTFLILRTRLILGLLSEYQKLGS